MRRSPSLSRRALLGGALAGVAATTARAGAPTVSGADRRFVFVMNFGGWDPLMVFAPMYGYPQMEMEVTSELGTVGGIPFVAHPDRPSVRTFFEAHHQRTLVWNGLAMGSLSHIPAQRGVMTGYTHEEILGDWPTLLAHAQADRYPLPSVIITGPSYSGDYAEIVGRCGSNGQLGLLLSGEMSTRLDVPVPAPLPVSATAGDRWLAARAALFAREAGPGRAGDLARGYQRSLDRLGVLKGTSGAVDWTRTATWSEQVDRTVEILASGLARSVSLVFSDGNWDSHAYNDAQQTGCFESLFEGLNTLCGALQALPGTVAPTLAEEVVVVVLSELGRFAAHNPSQGRDHWTYTSAMLVGEGFTGDRVIGGYDEEYYGMPVDPATAELAADGLAADSTTLGATLLALGDVDPFDALPNGTILEGILT